MRERLRALDGNARSIFLHLRLLERPADEALLRKLTGLSPPPFQSARLRLEHAGLVKGNRNGRYVPPGVSWELSDSGFDEDAVRETHETIGLCLLKDPRRLREAAHHLLHGGRAADGIQAAERAGAKLRAAGRMEEALSIYAEALEHATAPDVERRSSRKSAAQGKERQV